MGRLDQLDLSLKLERELELDLSLKLSRAKEAERPADEGTLLMRFWLHFRDPERLKRQPLARSVAVT